MGTNDLLSSEEWAAIKADPHFRAFVEAAVGALTAMLTGRPQPVAGDDEGREAVAEAVADDGRGAG